MEKYKTDISYWEKEFPFLSEVWSTFNDFDKNVDHNRYNYNKLCTFILKKEYEDLSMYNDFCMKVMRNLGYYSMENNSYNFTEERCTILYNWIYNSIIKNQTTVDVVNKILKPPYGNIFNNRIMERCSFKSYDEFYKEPIKITLLDIFIYKTPNIDTLFKTNGKNKLYAQKFICECVKICKYMNEKYCPNEEGTSEDYRNTCLKLKSFKALYMSSLYNVNYSSPIIPSLDNIDVDLSSKCPEHEKSLQLDSDVVKTQMKYSGNDLFTDTEGQSNVFTEDTTISHGNIDVPMKKTITTTIGTFAGASLPLVLLYKVNAIFYLNICKILHTYDYTMSSY
ncbi:hypothetical protein PCYB_004000 [Plasmodium cynomolgi strain B]|uniref:Uncharacterized protein n=1 Tax=Plasmodium cynomolgi (strain B) TaxID=1120755 RepID=K6UF83_PLACD|nr:hypothetical protein PCYB_004000 [Plasmodium cynomolgi strain B]GAB69651.1 hypothetical protein PCYB_004000 [Plasmodium cynomolgi strain B]